MDLILNSIIAHFGTHLETLYRYGQNGLPQSHLSEIHLLAVVSDGDSVLKPYRKPWFKTVHSLKLFTRSELESSLDVFPLEFLDMKRDRALLFGDDLLAHMEVSVQNVRHQVEYLLRSSLLQLRQTGVLAPSKQTYLISTITGDIVRSLRGLLNTMNGLSLVTSHSVLTEVEKWAQMKLPWLTQAILEPTGHRVDSLGFRQELVALIEKIDSL